MTKYCCVNCEEAISNGVNRTCSCKKCAKRECKTCFEHCWKMQIKRGTVSKTGECQLLTTN